MTVSATRTETTTLQHCLQQFACASKVRAAACAGRSSTQRNLAAHARLELVAQARQPTLHTIEPCAEDARWCWPRHVRIASDAGIVDFEAPTGARHQWRLRDRVLPWEGRWDVEEKCCAGPGAPETAGVHEGCVAVEHV